MASFSSSSLFSPAWSSSASNGTWSSSPILIPAWFPHPSTFLRLSHPTSVRTPDFLPDSQHYDKGWLDVAFVIGWVFIFAIVREIAMRGIFAPFMRIWLNRASDKRRAASAASNSNSGYASSNGHVSGNEHHYSYSHSTKAQRRRQARQSKVDSSPKGARLTVPSTPVNTKRSRRQDRTREKRVTRFAEQGWSFIYYTVYFSFGMVIHASSPWYPFNLDQLWTNYPENHMHLPGLVKFYYLTQLAFWFNQLVILNIEERRKDYYQMLSHHIVTICLIVPSYYMNCTRSGCIILVVMDFCDILLPLAKMLKYMTVPVLPDITFGLFLVSWLITRQFMFFAIFISVLYDAPRLMRLNWDPPSGAYLTQRGIWIFAGLLGSLLVLMCIWFIMIVRIAYNVLSGKPAEDTRSDDEDEGEK